MPSGYLVGIFRQFGLTAVSIPNFLNLSVLPYRQRSELRPRFLSNRNFEKHYNVGDILRAFAQIQREHPNAELVVVGDGPERTQLEALASQLALRNVTFEGAVTPSAMGGFYDKSDIYLNSPLIDNMPGSILEAFACGLPVVTSDAGGIPFIVRNEENGLLVQAGNPAALAEAALRLLHEPEFAALLAANARREAETIYTWDEVRLRWRDAYRGAELQRLDAPA
ncbi:MAG: glycosyltransferase family 4 protein [Fuerstia sp.]|nr:glycosyltransferase family 4 protein [Fuerstiella sp.]